MTDLGVVERCRRQNGLAEIGAAQVGFGKIGVGEIGLPQARLGKKCTVSLDITQAQAIEPGASENGASSHQGSALPTTEPQTLKS